MKQSLHIRRQQAVWYLRNKKYVNARRVAYDVRLKYDVLCRYSRDSEEGVWPPTEKSMPSCDCCGERGFGFLTLEHSYGARHSRYSELRHRGGSALYRELKRKVFPPGFEVLCFNCNHAYGHYQNRCPHQHKIKFSSQHWDTKFKVFSLLGDRCVCCDEKEPIFLTIDHIHGGGGLCREKNGDTYRAVVKGKIDLKSVRILCHNCNSGKEHRDTCPHEIKNWASWIKEKASVVGMGHTKGADNYNSVLTEGDVRRILRLRETKGFSGAKLGSMFGVSDALIYNILNGKTWSSVTGISAS